MKFEKIVEVKEMALLVKHLMLKHEDMGPIPALVVCGNGLPLVNGFKPGSLYILNSVRQKCRTKVSTEVCFLIKLMGRSLPPS